MTVEFFHECIGQYLGNDLGVNGSSAAILKQRASKGVKPLRLGAIDAFYIAKRGESKIIGRIEEPNRDGLVFLGTENLSARKYLANWLIHQAQVPFMIGLIGNANPNSSFEISQSLSRVTFCESGKTFRIDVEKLRRVFELLKDHDWKKVVSITIHAVDGYRNCTDSDRDKFRTKLEKIFEKNPEAKDPVLAADIRTNSGEYTMMSWYNIEEKVSEHATV